MSEIRPEPPVDLGIYGRKVHHVGLDPTDRIALVATAIWVLAAVIFVFVMGVGNENSLGPIRFLIVLMAIFLPVALIWIAAIALKSARIIREESERLQASMDAMRQIYVSQAQIAATTMGPNVERKIDEIAKGQQRAETALATFATSRPVLETEPSGRPLVSQPVDGQAAQPALALNSERPHSDVSVADFISALNFPETADDRQGFASLRRALADHRAAPLIRASQDVLTLLSQDGIYMDDLSPDRARPEVWRRFAAGGRGREISGLGGVRDRSSLALSSSRMRQDMIFRDSAHHFLRAFDRTVSQMAETLTDQELVVLAETRTARAFMLLGRVAGMFD